MRRRWGGNNERGGHGAKQKRRGEDEKVQEVRGSQGSSRGEMGKWQRARGSTEERGQASGTGALFS